MNPDCWIQLMEGYYRVILVGAQAPYSDFLGDEANWVVSFHGVGSGVDRIATRVCY
jgi:hypothetical protein